MLAEQTHFRYHYKIHFGAWKTYTKRHVQGRRDKSDALYRVLCLRMVWSRWNRAVSLRKFIGVMGGRRLDILQLVILQRWRTHTRKRIKLKVLTTKVTVFRKTKLRSKAWKSWLWYINYCHHKHQELVWVLSYYSVEVLLRRCMASWRKLNQKGDIFSRWQSYWRERQSINENRLQARVFRCVRMEQKVLATWRNFVRVTKQTKVAIAFRAAKNIQESFRFWKGKVHMLRQMRKMLLYQESFRVQTHFDAWKRFMVTRKQMSARLRKAMKFNDKLRKLDVWQKWSTKVAMQQQTRATVELAVAFRQRFFIRKVFAVWKVRICSWKRQRVLRDQALFQYKIALLHHGFQVLSDWRKYNMRFTRLQCKLSTRLAERRKCRAISNLRALCTSSNRKRSLIESACAHWQACHQLKYWGQIMQWFSIAKYRKLQRIRAAKFARIHLACRCIRALQGHICHTKQVKAKIEIFRCRYFRSVADDCFYQWTSFTTFKLKLRHLRHKTLHSQRRQRLQQWYHIAVEQVRRRAGMREIAAKRRRRELRTWLNHWESVCTDQWIDKELIEHHQCHAQKQRKLCSAVKTLKSQLAVRHERWKCKTFFHQHQRIFLIQVLHHWRHVTCEKM
ncbi:hypothetical protein PHMEG_00012892 [Phytophthora megakarya]|uniref:Sfi1 spindle body domain-containing protein n=1 Tax=Phytophthora megakarya TaxID=4795 RepID=A0A225WA87_9STRA|nr:hypothetical protein PHMEG_00012892 [Phytophthora megakarya]